MRPNCLILLFCWKPVSKNKSVKKRTVKIKDHISFFIHMALLMLKRLKNQTCFESLFPKDAIIILNIYF